MTPRFVIATFNHDKARELAAVLDLPGTEFVLIANWPEAVAPAETGATLLENARLKALAAMRRTGLPAIADDTGLEVDALGGRPGVHTARYAGPDATAAQNVARLLVALETVPEALRTARFRTVCVAVFPDSREVVAEGVLEGNILWAPRGENGFGYDPVFRPAGRESSLAELREGEKNSISHRAQAVKSLAARLGSL